MKQKIPNQFWRYLIIFFSLTCSFSAMPIVHKTFLNWSDSTQHHRNNKIPKYMQNRMYVVKNVRRERIIRQVTPSHDQLKSACAQRCTQEQAQQENPTLLPMR